MNRKIMNIDTLEDTVSRMEGCRVLLNVLTENAGISSTPEEALQGLADLLGSICRDFQADIDTAEDYPEGVHA